jgi:hypothetical protein
VREGLIEEAGKKLTNRFPQYSDKVLINNKCQEVKGTSRL